MNRNPLLPIYLLIDVAHDPVGDSSGAAKDRSVNAFLQGFVAELRSDADLASRATLTWGSFGRTATRHARALRVEHLTGLPEVRVWGHRSYSAAFSAVNAWMGEDYATFRMGEQSIAPPLLLVLTGAAPDAGENWRSDFDELTRCQPQITVRPVYHHGGHRWASVLRFPVDAEHGQAPQELEDPVAAAAAIVKRYAAQYYRPPSPVEGQPELLVERQSDRPVERQPDRLVERQPDRSVERQPELLVERAPVPPPAAPEPGWVGAFTSYAVGDPGAAAAKVKPLPDPTEWDRRDTVLDGVYIRDDANRPVVQLRAASVRGLGHRYNGTVRQDEYGFRCTDDRRYLVVIVSDGVSNSRLSHKAAGLITRLGAELVALALARRTPEQIDWAEIVAQLSEEIVRVGRKLVEPPADGSELGYRAIAGHLAATALFAVVDLRPVDGELLTDVFAVGDSSAWVLRNGKVWEPMHEVKNSGDGPASATTPALPVTAVQFADPVGTRVRRGDVLVLMSDGIGDPLHDGNNAVGRFLAESWREPPAPLEFAAQVDFARKTQDDDRTAVAIWVE